MKNQLDDFYWFNQDGTLQRFRHPSPNSPGHAAFIVTVPGDMQRKTAIKLLRRLAGELENQGKMS